MKPKNLNVKRKQSRRQILNNINYYKDTVPANKLNKLLKAVIKTKGRQLDRKYPDS